MMRKLVFKVFEGTNKKNGKVTSKTAMKSCGGPEQNLGGESWVKTKIISVLLNQE